MSRWSEAVWRPSTAHGGTMTQHRGLVLHIADGYYEGTLSWQHNPKNKVSSHFVVGRGSGQLAQVVDTDVASWAQRAGNTSWLSSENEGFSVGSQYHPAHPGWEKLTDWQILANARLLLHAHHQYGVPLQLANNPAERGLGHHSMGRAWGHQSCPGAPIIAQKAAIVALAKKLNSQVPAPGKDEVLSKLPTLKQGATGGMVVRAQVLANATASGSNITADGDFGPATVAIIKRVQAAGKLTPDGIVGPDTWCVLLGVEP